VEVLEEEEEDHEYGEQVIESWNDVIEESPEDLEAAVTALIAVVYRGEQVDVETMLRRSQLPDLYKYLKQQYWYKLHTNPDFGKKSGENDIQRTSTEIMTVDDMLKGRLTGMIASVQERHRQMEDSFSNRSGSDNLDESAHVTKEYVMRIKSQGGYKGGGRHVAQDYAQAVENRAQAMHTVSPDEEPAPAKSKTKDSNSLLGQIESAKDPDKGELLLCTCCWVSSVLSVVAERSCRTGIAAH